MRSTLHWLTIVVASTLCLPAFGQAMLVSEEEVRTSAGGMPPVKEGEEPELVPRSAPDLSSPRIEIMQPDIKSAVASPTRVQLVFHPVAPATIQPATFRALYGTFRIDITKRLLQYAKVTAAGINVDEAAMPAGSHRIFLEVQDSAGRTGSQLLSFTIQ
jgi:hypothetical protein